MNRLISASTPATMRNTSARSDFEVTWIVMSDGRGLCTSRISTSGFVSSNRDSRIVYSLAEVTRERRDGYGWYTYDPQQVLNAYPEWKKKWSK